MVLSPVNFKHTIQIPFTVKLVHVVLLCPNLHLKERCEGGVQSGITPQPTSEVAVPPLYTAHNSVLLQKSGTMFSEDG